jgi:hypothetical protein
VFWKLATEIITYINVFVGILIDFLAGPFVFDGKTESSNFANVPYDSMYIYMYPCASDSCIQYICMHKCVWTGSRKRC